MDRFARARTSEGVRLTARSKETVHALPDEALGNTSYLVDLGGGLAASVDPRRDIDGHIELADRLGLRVIAGLETHLHADFVSGSRELAANPLLRIDDEDTFIRALQAGFGSFPPYFLRLHDVNRRPARLGELALPQPLDPETAQSLVTQGAWLVDARPIHEWARAHPQGAVSIELRPAFASWLGWVIPFGAPIVLLVDDADRAEAVRLAQRIGYDRVLGWIDGGIDAWNAANLSTQCTEETDGAGARRRIASGAALVDVRQTAELTKARIPDAVHIELGDIIAGRTPDANEAVVFCGHGERSATAASLLERRRIKTVNLVGGIGAWEAAGLPIDQ